MSEVPRENLEVKVNKDIDNTANIGKWLGFLALLISLYILWQIRVIVLLAFTAIILATALNRMVRRFQKSGANRSIAIALSVGISLTVLIGFLSLIVIPFADQLKHLSLLIPVALERLEVWLNYLQARMPELSINNITNFANLSKQLQSVFAWAFANFYLLFSNSLNFIVNSLLILVLTIMFLVNPQQYRRGFIKLFPAFYRQRVDRILSKCEKGIIGWLEGIALSMTFIGVTSILGLWILQVPLPFVNGLLAALLAFIPYFGAILSVVPPMLLALLVNPWKAFFVLLLYIIIQQIEGNFVTPVIMKNQVSLLPAYTLAIMTAFGTFFGLLGLFLALPILVVAQTWIKEVLIKDVLDNWQKNRKARLDSPLI